MIHDTFENIGINPYAGESLFCRISTLWTKSSLFLISVTLESTFLFQKIFQICQLIKPNDAVVEYDLGPYIEDLVLEGVEEIEVESDEEEEIIIDDTDVWIHGIFLLQKSLLILVQLTICPMSQMLNGVLEANQCPWW